MHSKADDRLRCFNIFDFVPPGRYAGVIGNNVNPHIFIALSSVQENSQFFNVYLPGSMSLPLPLFVQRDG